MHRHALSELEPALLPSPLTQPRAWPRARGRTAMGLATLAAALIGLQLLL